MVYGILCTTIFFIKDVHIMHIGMLFFLIILKLHIGPKNSSSGCLFIQIQCNTFHKTFNETKIFCKYFHQLFFETKLIFWTPFLWNTIKKELGGARFWTKEEVKEIFGVFLLSKKHRIRIRMFLNPDTMLYLTQPVYRNKYVLVNPSITCI